MAAKRENEFTKFIRELREHANKSQAKLGEDVGLQSWTISQIEHGRMKLPEDKLETYAKALDVPLERLREVYEKAMKAAETKETKTGERRETEIVVEAEAPPTEASWPPDPNMLIDDSDLEWLGVMAAELRGPFTLRFLLEILARRKPVQPKARKH